MFSKKVAIKKKGPMPIMLEHEVTNFYDHKHNKMVAIRVRMPGATQSNHLKLSLKMKGSSQYLSIQLMMSPWFFAKGVNKQTFGAIFTIPSRNWHNFLQEQEKSQKQYRKAHGTWTEKEEMDNFGGQEPVAAVCDIKLGFICDDLFDPTVPKSKKYDGTNFLLAKVPLPGQNPKDEKDREIMSVLVVTLVAKEKEPEPKQATPVATWEIKVDANSLIGDGDGRNLDEEYD